MIKSGYPLMALAAIVALLALAPAARAQNAKSWVSNAGSNANPCTLAQPCATFQRAHDQTNPGGEVGVQTPGDYGGGTTVLLSKSINIINDGGGEASVLAASGLIGININANTGDVVILRGLVVDGQVNGAVGIDIFHASAVHVQNCIIRNFEAASSGLGIVFQPTSNSQLFVSDTLIYNNGGTANSGGIRISAVGSLGIANVVLDHVHLENNVFGIQIFSGGVSTANPAGSHVILRDSVVSGNFGNGVHALTAPGKGAAFAVIERTSIVNNQQNGILADGPGATFLLSDSTVSRNGAGISTVNSGQLLSYGNNLIDNNIGPDGVPTGSLALN